MSADLSHAASLLEKFQGVNDPYVTERLLAACYGAVMQGADRSGCKTVAGVVWRQFFVSGRRPPLHLLSRDYALGILECAHAVGEMPAEVELDTCQTGFTSDWPLENVTEEQVEAFKDQAFHDSIVSSTSEHGDFGNYTVRRWLIDITQMQRSFAGRTTKDTRPDGEPWLVLDGFRRWRVPGQNKRNHSEAWSRITCLVTAKGDGQKLARELLRKHRGDSSRLPGDKSLSCFLGEHGWRDDQEALELEAWEFSGIRTPCTGIVSTLTAEAATSDNSIEDNFTLHVPSAGLMRTLGLKLKNGKSPEYVDSGGITRLIDPSLRTQGPSAGLVSRDFFLQGLERAGFEPVWVLAGEKNVYAANPLTTQGFGGRVYHTTLYRMNGGILSCEGELIKEHRPTPDQIKALYAAT